MEASSSDLDLKRIVRLISRKKALFLATTAVVTSLIVLVGYLLPKTYEAKSVIFIEGNVLNELIKNVTVTSSLEDKARALAVVMKSRGLLQKVIRDLDLDVKAKNADAVEGMISHFQEKTEIKTEINRGGRRDSMDLFTVSYTGSDPRLASNYVNMLIRRYIEENLSLKRQEAYGANSFLLGQISSFKGKLDKIETAIAKQMQGKNTSEKGMTLYERLQTLLKRKDELLVQYTENHPEVVRLNSEIEMLKEQMRKSPTAAVADNALLDLERERETTKKIYEDLMATLRKSEVSTQLEVQDKAGAFRILDPAIVPTKPLSPNMVRMIFLAILGGIAAGMALIMVIDHADGSVKSVQAIRKIGLPVLAVISTMQTEEEAAKNRKKDGFVYALAGVYLAVLLTILTIEVLGLAYVDDAVQATRAELSHTVKKIWQRT